MSAETKLPAKCKKRFSVRLRGYVRGDVYYCSDRQPGCRRAATDYQRLDPDAEKVQWKFGDVQPELDGIS